MLKMWRRIFVFLTVLAVVAADPPVPWAVPFNNSVGYGPDGPWHFITLDYGNQPVDFYPAFGPSSNLMIRGKTCSISPGQGKCIRPQPNNYVTAASAPNASSYFSTTGYDQSNQSQLTGTGFVAFDSFDVPWAAENIQLTNTNDTLMNYPTIGSPQKQVVPLSILTLERTAAAIHGGPSNGTTLFSTYLNATKSSPALGITYGSVAFKQSASLHFSGYDQSRVIEQPTVFQKLGLVQLDSISFGTSSGRSPWAVDQIMPSNFIPQSNNGPVNTLLSMQTAYLNLPSAICNSMAQYLPVHYDESLELFLWNTTDPTYTDIVGSPSYINFTFAGSPGASIRLPFALLNLTLDFPLSDTPVPYFPCRAKSDASMQNTLGRVFLQAAYVMQSFDPPIIAIAQAPGPNVSVADVSPNPVLISTNNPTISPMANPPTWEETWSGILNPLGPDSGNNTGPSGSGAESNGNINTAATAGSSSQNNVPIGVPIGAALGGCALLAITIAFFCLRKKGYSFRKKDASMSPQPPPYNSMLSRSSMSKSLISRDEQVDPNPALAPRDQGIVYAYEMPGDKPTELQEIDGNQMRAEMNDVGAQQPAELDQDTGTTWRKFSVASRGRGLRQVRSDDWERYGNIGVLGPQ